MGPQLDSCGRYDKDVAVIAKPLLQWGRNLTVAEGVANAVYVQTARRLQWGRNLTVAEGRRPAADRQTMRRFNGAAT